MLGLLVSDSGVIRPGSAESGIRREMKPHLAERNVDVFRKAANAERGRTR
jgi:Pyruvate/2-oxoacid:ferredoxin oxidoreductase gamma subunit